MKQEGELYPQSLELFFPIPEKVLFNHSVSLPLSFNLKLLVAASLMSVCIFFFFFTELVCKKHATQTSWFNMLHHILSDPLL